jgi:hypothetical protein
MTQDTRPQVAILTSNFHKGNELGQIFKKLKIVPDTFDNTESFLISQIEEGYDFYILDISMALYEGMPLFERRELKKVKFAFMHNESQYSELNPTYNIDHLGYINNAQDMVGQVKNILSKYNRDIKVDRELEVLRDFHNDYKSKQEKLLSHNQALTEKVYYRDMLFEIIKDIQLVTNYENRFESIVAKSFDKKDVIEGYAYFEMNDDSSKLLPMRLEGEKKISAPALWLGSLATEEAEDQVIAVAQNILATLVNSPIIAIPLSYDGEDISGLLVLSVKEEVLFALDWEVVEITIRGVYAQAIRRAMPTMEVREISRTPFDLMAKLSYSSENRNLVSIDLSDIFDFMQVRKEVEFNWSAFWQDFKYMLSQIVEESEVYNVSLDTVAYSIENKFYDEAFDATKDLCGKFSLSKYFIGVSRLDIQGLKIHVREVPYSEFGLINHMEQKTMHMNNEINVAGEALL